MERIKVPAEGPTQAKIVIVGEAPGETEEKHGKPFCGMAGAILNSMLEEVGIKREECYVTNVYKYRPPANDLSRVEEADLAQGRAELEEELTLVKPNVIIAMGEYALNTITGKKGITKWRGSILASNFGKVIPTIHPAAISREWKFRPMVVCDLIKAGREASTKEIVLTPRELVVNPSFEQITAYLDDISFHRKTVAFDIEVETAQVTCISFAVSPTYSMCIPFWFGASGSKWDEETEMLLWEMIKAVLEDSLVKKIAQNAQYDMTILRDKYDINVKGLFLDTMLATHVLYPELPKSLAVLTSLYTDVPFYKYQRLSEDMLEFFRYNALDSAVTFECAEKLHKELVDEKLISFYHEHVHSLLEPLMAITQKGVRIDTEKKKGLIKTLQARGEDLTRLLELQVGHSLNVQSPKQMHQWLYKELGLRPKLKRRKGKEDATTSADADTLQEFYAETKNEALRTVLEIRECKKLLSTYLEVKYDEGEDGERARTSYLITGTETGRLSSRETVYGTGTNLQNVPKGLVRSIFIPDEGKVFINADLSQAEARVVAALAGELKLLRIFESGGDIHRKNAAVIYRKREEDVTKEERELAKRVVHASNYGMGPNTFGKTAGIPVSEAKKLLNLYFSEFPKIKLWHMATGAQLKRSRVLVTPYGRRRIFFNRWDSSLLKEGYAYVPQSTVADLLNMGLRRCYEKYKGSDVEILLQIHDAILLQCPIEKAGVVGKEVKETLTIPVRVNNYDLVIPVDISMGPTWDDLKKVSV